MQRSGAPLQCHPGACVWILCLCIAILSTFGCAVKEEEQPPKPSPATQSATLQATPEESPHKSEQAKIQETSSVLAGSGFTAWAKGLEGELIMGLDGQLWIPYNAPTIEHVQTLMKNRGLYSGPVNGVLDQPTMESIYRFQEATRNLLRCGVPTPVTRKLLEQGSHTDAAS